MLKDYMQTGKFNRGDQEFSAQCSIVLGGNIDTDMNLRQPEGRYRHLFEPLPPELQDPAFLDRIHAYLPGPGNAEDPPRQLRHRLRFLDRLPRRDFRRTVAAAIFRRTSTPGSTRAP